MTSQLPTYHGSPEDEGQLRLTESVTEESELMVDAQNLSPRKPDGTNLLLDTDVAELQFRQETEREHRSFLDRLFGIFTGSRDNSWEAELDRAIERYPEAASNYVLRGELLLKHGQAERAKGDFLQAYEISAEHVADDQFGFVAQMTQDRALDGLKRAKDLLGED